MAILKFKNNGKWESIAAFKGEPGKDGAIQYQAGEGINIEDNIISCTQKGSDGTNTHPPVYFVSVPKVSGGKYSLRFFNDWQKESLINVIRYWIDNSIKDPVIVVSGLYASQCARVYSCVSNYNPGQTGITTVLFRGLGTYNFNNTIYLNSLTIYYNRTDNADGTYTIDLVDNNGGCIHHNDNHTSLPTTTYVSNAITSAISTALEADY